MSGGTQGLCDEHAGDPYVRRCDDCEAIRDGQVRSPSEFAPMPEPDLSEWVGDV